MASGRTHLVIAVVGFVMLAGVVATWPRITRPGAEAVVIEARWAAIEGRAAAFGQGPADSPLLDAASGALRRWAEAREQLSGAHMSSPIARTALSEPASHALGELVRWAEASGDMPELCTSGASAIDLMYLGRLGMRAAVAVDDPSFTAALQLGGALRRRGTLLGTCVGFALAGDALDVAAARGWDAGEVMTVSRPTPEELRSGLARELVCTYQMVDRAFSEDCRPPWYYPLAERWCDNERQLYRDLWGERYEAADAHEDLAGFIDAFDRPDDDPPGTSLTLAATAMLVAGPLREASAVLERHDALARAPRGAGP